MAKKPKGKNKASYKYVTNTHTKNSASKKKDPTRYRQPKRTITSSADFPTALTKAFERNSTKPQEAYYLTKNFHKTIEQVKDIMRANPNITTKQDVEEKLILDFNNLTSYIRYAPSILADFYSYSAAKYIETHPNKYSELSKRLEESTNDFENSSNIKLVSFDDYLLEYLYSLKKSMFDSIKGDIPEDSTISSQQIIKSLDKFLLDYLKASNKNESKDSTDVSIESNDPINYRNNDYKEVLSSVMTNYLLSASSSKRKQLELELKPKLAEMISHTINSIDKISDLNNYLASYVYQMYKMGFSEIAKPFLKPEADEEELKQIAINEPYSSAIQKFDKSTDVSKLKASLSKQSLTESSLPIENLFALEAFWLNRLNKDLESYSESLFGLYNFGVIDPLIRGEEPKEISENDFQNLLIKMNTLYGPARLFLTNSKKVVYNRVFSFGQIAPRRPGRHIPKPTCKEKALAGKLCLDNISENNFSSYIVSCYGDEYSDYFNRMLPTSSNSIKTDAAWYLRLIKPILTSYKLKDNLIKNLISCIQANDKDSSFLNVGLLLDGLDENDTEAVLPETLGIGFDIGLSYPIRLHVPSYVLNEFIDSSKAQTFLPIFNGSKDFTDPQNNSSLLTSFVVYPYSEEQKEIIDQRLKQEPSIDSKSQNFIEHLCYIDKNHIPAHLNENSTSKVAKQIQKFVDLKTGRIYVKDQEGNLVPFQPIVKTNRTAPDFDDEFDER